MVPVAYGGANGPDLPEVARARGLSEADVVARHAGVEYTALFVGFLPGFAYLGLVAPELETPRRATPRARVPAGSVAMAGRLTGVYPFASPGGWSLIGRTGRLLFDPFAEEPALIRPGDRVRFAASDAEWAVPPPRTAPFPRYAPAVEVLDGGLLTTVQDEGRRGHRRLGVPWGGSLDSGAAQAANRAIGNPAGAAVLECTAAGPTLRFLAPTRFAVTGADLGAVLERSDLGTWAVPLGVAVVARPGNLLSMRERRAGLRAYVALAGGIDVPPVLGSRATNLVAGFGGIEGRALRAGDLIPVGGRAEGPEAPDAPRATPAPAPVVVRVVAGPQDDMFTDEARARLESEVYEVGPLSDRTGCRLTGAPPRAPRGRRDPHRRHGPGVHPGAARWAADRHARRWADDGRLSEDRDGGERRPGSPRAMRGRRPDPVPRGHRRGGAAGALGAGLEPMEFALPPSVLRALEEWAAMLRVHGRLAPGASLPLRTAAASTAPGRLPDDVGLYASGGAVIGLSARRCGLTSLPGSTADLGDLQSLDLTGNALESLPASIGGLGQLRRLHLDGNALTSLPDSIGALARLEELHLDTNPLATLPRTLGRLEGLRTLSLYGNALAAVPPGIETLGRLEYLSVGRNQVTSIPDFVWGLGSLRTLIVAETRLTSVAERIGRLTRLEMIDLGHNALTALPEALGALPALTSFLYLSHNRLTEMPAALTRLASLRYLNVTDNGLRALPGTLGDMRGLVELRLYGNQLGTLPESIGALDHLQELHLSNNALVALPAAIGRLRSLTHLDLRNNALTALPREVGGLQDLAFLDLRANRLTAVPAVVETLPRLRKLDLRWNKLDPPRAWRDEMGRRGCVVYV